MAKRGPKHKPTNLKVVTGTARPARVNKAEPQPDTVRLPAPAHLSEEAVEEWDRVIETLFNLGIVTSLDRAALAAYCQAYGRWVQAERALELFAKKDAATKGIMMKTTSGNAIQNPLVGAANKAMSDMVRYAAEFGMTPSARVRVKSENAKETPEARFFGE